MSLPVAAPQPRSLIDGLLASFSYALRTAEEVAEPIAILWPDPDGQWQPVVGRLRSTFPYVFTLGEYDTATLTGPAIWLRCVVDRSLPEISPSAGTVPVLYLPGVSRQALRAGGDCPPALQPLVELQFRGKVWHHPNNREWTAEGFLTSDGGLALDMSKDNTTREAMLRVLPLLADTDVTPLRGHRLSATDFDKLAVDDPVRDLLRWMNDPIGTRAGLAGPRWPALRSMIRSQFDFDPEDEPPTAAGSRLVKGGGPWDALWKRFCESPQLYPGIPRLMREPAVDTGELALDGSRRPGENDEAEKRLGRDLEAASKLQHHEACARVLALEAEHGVRRTWVWAEVGESPLAKILEPMARLAAAAGTPLAGSSVQRVVDQYAAEGWRCDAAAIATLAVPLGSFNQALIERAVRALYLSWLDDSARRFQELAAVNPDLLGQLVTSPTPEKDTCILFVDGLRFDVGGSLQELLESRGLPARLTHRIAPLPSVTPTAKAAAAPIADSVAGTATTNDFCPALSGLKQAVTAQRLRDTMIAQGIEVLQADEVRIPTGSQGGWTEGGQLDELGHKLGVRLAGELRREVERLADRIGALLDAGWRRVRVVTDHGWLLMPGGLPKVDMPKFLTETRWSRCAAVKGESSTTMPVWPWYWNPQVRIATPHGVACFLAGNDYAHGGVSVQELVTPELLVERGVPVLSAKIAEVSWTRLRCRVTVSGGAAVKVDIRTNWKDPGTSIVAGVKEPDGAGLVSLVAKDEEYEGLAAHIVLLDATGHVMDRKATTVGDA